MSKRKYEVAFGPGIFNSLYTGFHQAFKKHNPGGYPKPYVTEQKMAKTMLRGRKRSGSKYIRKRKPKRRYGRGLHGKIKRINRTLFRSGLKSIETKYVRVGRTETLNVINPADSSAAINLLQAVDQGVEQDQILGGKCFIKHIRMRYVIRAGTNTGETYCRVLVVRDKQPAVAGTPPQLNDVVDLYYGSTPATTSEADQQLFLWKYINNRNRGRFQILADKWHKIVPTAAAGDAMVASKINISVMKPWRSEGTETGMLGNRGPGQIYYFVWSNTLTNGPTMNVVWRTSYTDC